MLRSVKIGTSYTIDFTIHCVRAKSETGIYYARSNCAHRSLRLTDTVTKSIRSVWSVSFWRFYRLAFFYPWGDGVDTLFFITDPRVNRFALYIYCALFAFHRHYQLRTIRNSAPSSSLPRLNSWRFVWFTQQVARRRNERRLQNRRRSHDVRVPKLHTHGAASRFTRLNYHDRIALVTRYYLIMTKQTNGSVKIN